MADQSVTPSPGERFRRNELRARLISLAELLMVEGLPVPRFDRTPMLEFHLRSEAEVDRVAAAIGTTPKRVGPEYFTGIENAELRVRWTAHVPAEISPKLHPDFIDGPCEDAACPNASWPHSASSDLTAPDPTGLAYSREADDSTPPGPREPMHAGVVTDNSLVPAPIAAHYDASATASEFVCACGDAFGDESSLMVHVADGIAQANASGAR